MKRIYMPVLFISQLSHTISIMAFEKYMSDVGEMRACVTGVLNYVSHYGIINTDTAISINRETYMPVLCMRR